MEMSNYKEDTTIIECLAHSIKIHEAKIEQRETNK